MIRALKSWLVLASLVYCSTLTGQTWLIDDELCLQEGIPQQASPSNIKTKDPGKHPENHFYSVFGS